MFNVKFADDWIRMADFWSQKRLLYQLRHYHCPDIIKLWAKSHWILGYDELTNDKSI